MISVQEARQIILSSFHQLEPTFVPIGSAVDRVLVKPIYSNSDFPSFDNSSVDGFAVRAEDIANSSPSHPTTLQVIGDIPAGKITSLHISSGQAARIMTGAPLPEGANTVIMIEDTDAYPPIIGSHSPDFVSIFRFLENGENIRRIGADIKSNQEILHAGVILRPQDIGVLAMIGIENVLVTRKPKIAIISTGDELVPVGTSLEIGKIHDSNSYMLAALAQKAGCDVIQFGIASDHYQAVENIMTQASNAGCDLIITSAGVSTGAFDFVKEVVESSGFLNFWKVNMRPGKPLAFGSYRSTPFVGLPGNPVASFVSFIVFVRPSIELMSGIIPKENSRIKVTLLEGIESDGRESYLRSVVEEKDGTLFATLTGHQGSGNLFSLVQANSLLIIPSGVKFCSPGTEVEAWILEKLNG